MVGAWIVLLVSMVDLIHGKEFTLNNTKIKWTNPIVTDIIKSSRIYFPITRGNSFISIYTCDEELLVPKDNEILSKKHWFNDSLIELWMRW